MSVRALTICWPALRDFGGPPIELRPFFAFFLPISKQKCKITIACQFSALHLIVICALCLRSSFKYVNRLHKSHEWNCFGERTNKSKDAKHFRTSTTKPESQKMPTKADLTPLFLIFRNFKKRKMKFSQKKKSCIKMKRDSLFYLVTQSRDFYLLL